MTLQRHKRAATVLTRIVKSEIKNAGWNRWRLQQGLHCLAAHAQQMGLVPEDMLTRTGQDAFVAIARSRFRSSTPLDAEWRLVVQLAAI